MPYTAKFLIPIVSIRSNDVSCCIQTQRRIAEIVKLSDLFRHNGYTKTAKDISSFANILEGNHIPSDFLKRLDSVFRVFHIDSRKRYESVKNIERIFSKR